MDFHIELVIRFDYGVSVPWVMELRDGEGNLAVSGRMGWRMCTVAAPLQGKDLRSIGEFSVNGGETIPFVLSYGRSYGLPPAQLDPRQALAKTETFLARLAAPMPDRR